MRVDDLIKDKWYKIYSKNDDFFDCFKFEKIEDNKIYSYNFYISPYTKIPYTKIPYTKIVNHLCSVIFLDNYKISEIDISEIVNYLPQNNPDKINYFRNQRIKQLLAL